MCPLIFMYVCVCVCVCVCVWNLEMRMSLCFNYVCDFVQVLMFKGLRLGIVSSIKTRGLCDRPKVEAQPPQGLEEGWSNAQGFNT